MVYGKFACQIVEWDERFEGWDNRKPEDDDWDQSPTHWMPLPEPPSKGQSRAMIDCLDCGYRRYVNVFCPDCERTEGCTTLPFRKDKAR